MVGGNNLIQRIHQVLRATNSAVIALIALSAYLTVMIVERIQLETSGFAGGAVLLSSSQSNLEQQYKDLSKQLPIVVAVEGTPRGQMLEGQVKMLTKGSASGGGAPLIIMDQVRQRGASVYFGQTGVNLGLAQLHQSETTRSRSVAPLLVGFTAFLVGIMWRPQRLATALLVGLAALVASVRYFYRCVTCPDVVLPVLQVDVTVTCWRVVVLGHPMGAVAT